MKSVLWRVAFLALFAWAWHISVERDRAERDLAQARRDLAARIEMMRLRQAVEDVRDQLANEEWQRTGGYDGWKLVR